MTSLARLDSRGRDFQEKQFKTSGVPHGKVCFPDQVLFCGQLELTPFLEGEISDGKTDQERLTVDGLRYLNQSSAPRS
jgi:hypothetical protein